jgi:hypothetical protein
MTDAQHFSIVIADVEGSGSLRDSEKTDIRHDLYGLLRTCLRRHNVDWKSCPTEDRGDGVYILVPGTIPKRRLGIGFVNDLNRMLGERRVRDAQMRLRLALHCGEVTRDEHGSSGADVDQAFAMVDNQGVRDVLTAAPRSRMVVVTSDAIFRAAFCSHPDDDPTWMRRQYLRTKRDALRVWIGVPGLRYPPVVDAPEEPTGPSAAAGGQARGGQTYVAPMFWGDNNASVAGGAVSIGGDYAPHVGVPNRDDSHE